MWIYLKKYPDDIVIILIYLLVLILTTVTSERNGKIRLYLKKELFFRGDV